MSTSVIEILKGLVTPSLLNTVAPVIGLNGDLAGRGLNDMIGQYLGALVQQSGDRDAMAKHRAAQQIDEPRRQPPGDGRRQSGS